MIRGKTVCKENKPTDKEMLDWLKRQTTGYGCGWICRKSQFGRGIRLHETSREDALVDVRDAIATAMKDGI